MFTWFEKSKPDNEKKMPISLMGKVQIFWIVGPNPKIPHDFITQKRKPSIVFKPCVQAKS